MKTVAINWFIPRNMLKFRLLALPCLFELVIEDSILLGAVHDTGWNVRPCANTFVDYVVDKSCCWFKDLFVSCSKLMYVCSMERGKGLFVIYLTLNDVWEKKGR